MIVDAGERIRSHRQRNALEVLAHDHRVEYAPRAECGQIFDFYMGKNTPERKDYIMDSLVKPVEELVFLLASARITQLNFFGGDS